MQSSLIQQPQGNRDYTFGSDNSDNVSRSRREFIIENSWGAFWGDRGYAALSFDDVLKNGFEFFVVREFAGIQTKLNPQYSTAYNGEVVPEADDALIVPPAPEASSWQSKQKWNSTATLFFIIAAVIYFLTSQK
jgi:hypothetical protein